MPNAADIIPAPAPSPAVPVPYASVGPNVPAGTSVTHLRVLDSQRALGLSPQGARQAASGRPLTGLGDQTRVFLNPGSSFRPSQIPVQLGDQAGVAGGTLHTGLSPAQFKLLIPG